MGLELVKLPGERTATKKIPRCNIPPKTFSGEPVKTTRVFLLLLAVLFCLPGLAQSNAHPDYAHQHKDAEKYQKHLMKERNKQAKERAKAAKADHKHYKQKTSSTRDPGSA